MKIPNGTLNIKGIEYQGTQQDLTLWNPSVGSLVIIDPIIQIVGEDRRFSSSFLGKKTLSESTDELLLKGIHKYADAWYNNGYPPIKHKIYRVVGKKITKLNLSDKNDWYSFSYTSLDVDSEEKIFSQIFSVDPKKRIVEYCLNSLEALFKIVLEEQDMSLCTPMYLKFDQFIDNVHL